MARYILLLFLVWIGCALSADASSVLDSVADQCGKTRLRGGTIVGGVVAGQAEFPWMASIQLSANNKNNHFCGGAIISDRWILTAGHCFLKIFKMKALDRVSVLVGTNQLSSGGGDRYEIEQAIIHKNFEMENFHDDITLIRTKKPIVFRKTDSQYLVNAICLGPYRSVPGRFPYPPPEAIVAGWGSVESGSEHVSDRLLKVSVSNIDSEKCYWTYANNFHLKMSDKVLCYGRNMKDSCQGDSGGPLLKQANGRSYSVGVVSFGAGCGTYPGVYTDVAKYRDWIEENVF